MEEIWKDIEGYEGLYQISSLGRVRSLDRFVSSKNGSKRSVNGQIIKLFVSKTGYIHVNLWHGYKYKTFRVHRLVATAFIPNPGNLPEVNHKNEIKTDNSMENLEWCTGKYNSNYGTRKERSVKTRKDNGDVFFSDLARRNQTKSVKKRVIQCGMDGNEIFCWLKMSYCCDENGKTYDTGLIGKVCKGVYNQAYGYKWKYA